MYEHCKSCVHNEGGIGFCDKCGYTYMLRKYGLPPTEYEAKPKPMTNADRIRAMTDEELAEFIAETIDCCNCKHPRNGCSENDETCAACWLDWLKEEAKE